MEIYIIIGVILVQIFVFIRAYSKIRNFGEVIPLRKEYRLFSYRTKVNPKEDDSPIVVMHKINTSISNDVFDNVVSSINNYLKKNKGATADMSLLANIVKRNISTLENEIGILIPLPLYLGLIGTMAGIVFGLFNIPSVGDSGFSDGVGIDILIGGVKYAMIASVAGILFTTLLSGWYFRKSKFTVESRVNFFLTFLETELLPVLKADVSANLHSLYQNLASFNHKFEKGVGRLSTIMDKTHNSVVSQVQLINELQKIDLAQVAKAHVEVFEIMGDLMPQFQSLNTYVTGLNQSIEVSKALTDNITGVLDRTQEVGEISTYLQESTNSSIKLNEMVEQHFSELQNRNQEFVVATNHMEDKAKLAIDHFRVFIEEQISALKEVTRREEELMIKTFAENRNVLDKLNELSEIKEELKKIREKPELGIEIGEKLDVLVKILDTRTKNSSQNKSYFKNIQLKTINSIKAFKSLFFK